MVLLTLCLGAMPGQAARRLVCLNNHRTMTAAWFNHASDHNGALVGNFDGSAVDNLANSNATWCLGWVEPHVFVPANTNVLYLTAYSPLAVYLNHDARPFHCPSDGSTSAGKIGSARVRSISLNGYLGLSTAPYTSGYKQMTRISDVRVPSRTMAFTDERDDSNNDARLLVSMDGFEPAAPNKYVLVDYPAFWHENGCVLSFTDGHAESWTWQDIRTTPPYQRGVVLPLANPSPNNPDVARIQAATSYKID